MTLIGAIILLCSMTLLNRTQPTPTEMPIVQGETFSYEVVKKLMLVQAEVDGKKGYFLFDTGASHLTLNQKHFPEKKVVQNVGSTRNTLGGEQALHAMKVETFRWGSLQRSRLLTPIADLTTLEKTLGRTPLLGLIGYDIVKDYVVFFNYSQQTITLASNNDFQKEPTYSLDFKRCGHMPVLETSAATKRKMYLGLDSGASVNVLDASWKDQIEEYTRSVRQVNFTGSSAGTKQASFVTLSSLTIAQQLTLENVGMILTDFTREQGSCFRVDGLIGIDLFTGKDVAIDFPNNRLHIWSSSEVRYNSIFF